jgi:hypothetical protein
MRAGCGAAPVIASYITLVAGGSVGLAFTWGRKHLIWGLVLLLAAVIVTILEGSYRETQRLEETCAQELSALRTEHAAVLVEAQAKLAAPVHAPTFWNNQGGIVNGSEITNTYNESGKTTSVHEGFAGRLIALTPGAEINESSIHVHFGPPPPLPDPLPSTPEERAQLREQLLKLAADVGVVMAPWRLSTVDIARKMEIPSGQFMERIIEIRAEMTRVGAEVTECYNNECRSAVIQVYGHARSIGFADHEMELCWRTRLAAGASRIPARLRAIGMRIQD